MLALGRSIRGGAVRCVTWTEGERSGIEIMESTGLPALLGRASTEPLSDVTSRSSSASLLYLWARPFSSDGSVESCCLSSSSRSEMWWSTTSSDGACCLLPVSWAAGGSAISVISPPAPSSLSSDDALIGSDSCCAWLRARLWPLQEVRSSRLRWDDRR